MKTKKTIAILNSGIPKVNRGAEKIVIDLNSYLSSIYNVVLLVGGKANMPNAKAVFCIKRDNRLTNFIYQHIPDKLQRMVSRLHLSPKEFEKLTFSIFSLWHLLIGIDLILVATGFWGNLFCRLIRKIRGTPFISRGAGWKMSNYEIAKLKPDAHITLNPVIADYLHKKISNIPIKVIPNGIFLSKYDSAYIADENIVPENVIKRINNLEHPIFLCAAALEPVKRIDLTIRAIAKLDRGSLILLGNGKLLDELVNLGMELLGKNRFFQKYVSFSQMRVFYQLSDVFTIASAGESFGTVYIEAMACNKPIVTTRDKVREIIVDSAGILCNPENIEEYSIALKKALEIDWKDRPRKQAEKYDWKNVGRLYLEAINEVLENTKQK